VPVTVKHKLTGHIVVVPAHYIDHPVLGKNLEVVETEVVSAPKKENKSKEQVAPEAQAVKPEIQIETKEHKDIEDAN
jgi:hypothetical protein